MEHRPSTTPRHRTLFWAAVANPDQLIPCCFSSALVSPPTVARPASLPLPLRVPGQGLARGAGCWLPEGVSHPAPHPPQHLFGHWFLSRSLPQIFISDLLLPLDFVDAPQTGVDKCLDLLLHRLCCPPCVYKLTNNELCIRKNTTGLYRPTTYGRGRFVATDAKFEATHGKGLTKLIILMA